MITISLCLVVKDNIKVNGSIFESMKDAADEFVVMCTPSNASARELAGKYTKLIFDLQDGMDMANARNFLQCKSSMDYILWMDPGDELQEQDKQKLLKLKESLDPLVNAVTMQHRYILEPDMNVSIEFKRNSLVKNSPRFQWNKVINEYLVVRGNILDSGIVLIKSCDSSTFDRNVQVWENCLERGDSFTHRDLYNFADCLMERQHFQSALIYYKRFLEAKNGDVENKISACHKLADIYSNLGQKSEERQALLRSFEYGTPRAEFCCALGLSFLEDCDYEKAIFWYSLAAKLEKPEKTYEFFDISCWDWLPHAQLCICYYRLGEYEKSYECNEAALKLQPSGERVLSNKAFLENLLQNKVYMNANIITHKEKRLKIAHVSPNIITVPPKKYGGIERVVYDLTEELVKKGHEIYLYAPRGSCTSARLIPYEDNNIDITDFVLNTLPPDIDLIHDHTHPSYIGLKNLDIPTVCTIHDSRNNPVKYPVYLSARALEVVGGNRGFFIYNGIDPDVYEFSSHKQDYLLFMGELRWHKGILHALEIAERTQQKLIIAGPVFFLDYYHTEVSPRIRQNPNIQYVGPVGGKERQELFKNARCLVFPTSWEEPFGLVMIEAMACGTPVIALANGAVPEVMSGFPELICRSVDEMVDKVLHQLLPDSESLRKYVCSHFTTGIMADRYIELYNKLVQQ